MPDFLGDDPHLSVYGRSQEQMTNVLNLVHGFPAVGFYKETSRIILFKYNDSKMTPFLTSWADANMVSCMAFNWLQKDAIFPAEPDHDGENEKGWWIYNKDWGQISGYGHRAFLAIEPKWLMFGK